MEDPVARIAALSILCLAGIGCGEVIVDPNYVAPTFQFSKDASVVTAWDPKAQVALTVDPPTPDQTFCDLAATTLAEFTDRTSGERVSFTTSPLRQNANGQIEIRLVPDVGLKADREYRVTMRSGPVFFPNRDYPDYVAVKGVGSLSLFTYSRPMVARVTLTLGTTETFVDVTFSEELATESVVSNARAELYLDGTKAEDPCVEPYETCGGPPAGSHVQRLLFVLSGPAVVPKAIAVRLPTAIKGTANDLSFGPNPGATVDGGNITYTFDVAQFADTTEDPKKEHILTWHY